MPMNRIRFQKDLSLPEFMDRDGTEEQRPGLGRCSLAEWLRLHGHCVMPARTSFRRGGRRY